MRFDFHAAVQPVAVYYGTSAFAVCEDDAGWLKFRIGQAAEAGRQLKNLIPAEERPGLDVEMVILNGMPFLEIIRYAKANDVDLIVIGTHGRSGMEHIIFGSTAEKVVRKAPCPVLSVMPVQHAS